MRVLATLRSLTATIEPGGNPRMSSPSQQHQPGQSWDTIIIPSDLASAKEPERAILQAVADHGFNEDSIFAIKLTLEEAITNAIKHGNKSDRSKKVVVRYTVDAAEIVICIRDEGAGFDPDAVPDPTSPDRLSLPSGRGILLMRAYMNEIEYRHNGTEIILRKTKDS